MKCFVCFTFAFVLVGFAPAQPGKQKGRAHAPLAYVVLQDDDKDSLVGISADGTVFSTIAESAGGVALTTDNDGNYIVVGKSRLLRVTPSGNVSTIATAPSGVQWKAAAAEADGSFLVADAQQPVVWRVMPDGSVVAEPSLTRGLHPPSWILGVAVDQVSRTRWLLAEYGFSLKLVHQSGEAPPAEIVLREPAIKRPVGIVPDGSGGLLAIASDGLYHLAADGRLSRFGDVPEKSDEPTALARTPETGEILVLKPFGRTILRLNPDGSLAATLAVPPSVTFAKSVIPCPTHR
jgi:hypothetical protein